MQVLQSPTGEVVQPSSRLDWTPENWARWRGGSWGTVPRWEWRKGPGNAVQRLLEDNGGGWARMRVVGHVEAVWGSWWHQLARRGVVDPFVFGQRLAEHVLGGCAVCGSDDEFTARVWGICLRRLGLADVVKALQRGMRE